MGAKGRPSYRIVAADSRSPRDGRFIESVGYYDPISQPTIIKVNAERARYWLSVGAQPSDPVRSLFRRTGLLDKDGKVVPPAAEVAEPAAAPSA
jgi:small subunit ribosomal protein S16